MPKTNSMLTINTSLSVIFCFFPHVLFMRLLVKLNGLRLPFPKKTFPQTIANRRRHRCRK